MSTLEEVKILISSILVSNPYPSTVSGLKRDYFEQVGNHIPYQNLGYTTLEEFLRSIPDVIAISGSGNNTKLRAIINPKVAHIHKLTARQRKQSDRYASSSNFYGPRDSCNGSSKNDKQCSTNTYKEPNSSVTNVSTNSSAHLSTQKCNDSKLYQHAEEKQKKELLDTGVATTNATIENSKIGCVPMEVQNNLIKLISNFGSGFSYQELPNAYKLWFGKELDFREFNYNNLLEMCNDLQSVFCYFLTNEEELKLFDPSRPLPKDDYDYLKSCKPLVQQSQSQPGSHTSNVKQLISTSSSKFPSDLSQSKSLSKPAPSSQSTVSTKHERLIQSTSSSKPPSGERQSKLLNNQVQSSRSTSSRKLPSDVKHSKELIKPTRSRKLTLLTKNERLSRSTIVTKHARLNHSTSSSSPPSAGKQSTRLSKPAHSEHSSNFDITRCSSYTPKTEEIEYPPNVIKLSEHILREAFDEKKGHILIYVTEVYDPSKFWIVLKRYERDFKQMHHRMQYWTKFRENFEIPEKFVRCGLYCAVPYKNEYYRGIVVKLSLSRHVAKVYLVDFGTITVTNSTGLLFLHKEFGVFPQQAIRARLAGVKPAIANSPWCDDASKSFLKQVSKRIVMADFSQINNKTQIVELYLNDEMKTNSVNNILVKEGHATFDHEKQKENPILDVVPTVDLIHLYPTFNEIEQGLVPTVNETLKMKKSGRGYDYIYPKYFKKEVINISITKKETLQNLQKPEIVEKQSQAESLPIRKSLSLPKNQLHDEQLTHKTSSNLLKSADLDILELPQNFTGTCSNLKEILELSNSLKLTKTFEWSNNAVAALKDMPITSFQLNTSNINNLSNLENFEVKQKLESYLIQNLRKGNTISLYYIKHLLHELQPLIYPIQNVYNIVKDEYISLPPHILQIFISNLLNYFDTGKLLELYTFIYQISSPSKNSNGINPNKIIARTDFSGSLVYLYRLYDHAYVDMREMLQLTNLPELPLHLISNETDMADFIGSLLITTLIENPKLIQELERYKISFGEKLFLLKIQFIPKFYQIFANKVLPQGLFDTFLKKIDINGHPW